MNVVALGGEPGAGKSLVMRHAVAHLLSIGFEQAPGRFEHVHKGRRVSVSAVELKRTHDDGTVEHVIVLGRYDEGDTFPGTDRLSQGVQPAAEALIGELSLHAARNPAERVAVMFEGDRLFSRSFLLACASLPGVLVRACLLKAPPEQLVQRREGRGSKQNPSWMKGRATKVHSIEHWLRESGEPIEVLNNDASASPANLSFKLVELLDLRAVCNCGHVLCLGCYPS